MSNNDTKKITMDDMNIMKLVCFSKIECVEGHQNMGRFLKKL